MLSSDVPDAEQVPLHNAAAEDMPFHRQLRAATRTCHDEVDDLFGQFDLSDGTPYRAFLRAHARALLPLEAWIDPSGLSPLLGSRGNALIADLAALGEPSPSCAPLDWPVTQAARWGAAYVIEGSRLGGAVLKQSVPEELPSTYLAAIHGRGGWRDILAELDRLADLGGPAWRAEAEESAGRSFALFARAARDVGVASAA